MTEPRRTIGGHIKAKACHVSSEAECKRRFGRNWKSKEVFGSVVELKSTRNPISGHARTLVVGDFDIGGGTISRKEINIRSVRNVTLEGDRATVGVTAPVQVPDQQAALPTNGGTTTTTTPDAAAPNSGGTIANSGATTSTEDTDGLDVTPPTTGESNSPHNEETAPVGGGGTAAIIRRPAASCHGFHWHNDDTTSLLDVGGVIPFKIGI